MCAIHAQYCIQLYEIEPKSPVSTPKPPLQAACKGGIMGKTNTNVCKRKGERTHVRDTSALQTPLGGGGTGPSGGVGHPPARHPARGVPPAGRPRLDGGHRPDFFNAAGGQGLADRRQGGQPQRLHPHRHPAGLRRGLYAPAAGHPVRRQPGGCGAGPGQRVRGHPRPAGPGGRRDRGHAGPGGGVRQLRRVLLGGAPAPKSPVLSK